MIVIGVPHKDNITGETYSALTDMIIHEVKGQYMNVPVECSLLPVARNTLWNIAIQYDADYLVMIDTDTMFNSGTLTKILALDGDIAGGVIHCRREPFLPAVYNFDKNMTAWSYQDHPRDRVFECDAMGTGFMVISKRVMQALPKNPFDLGRDNNGGQYGEDISFCRIAHDRGFKCRIDPTILFGHKGSMIVTRAHYDAFKDQKAKEAELNGTLVCN